MTLPRATKSSFQLKTNKTKSYLDICACVFPQQRLTDQKSPPYHLLLCGNFTFMVHSCQSESTLRSAWQHKGFGADLLREAERIAREDFGLKKLLVISALGTRRYYMRFGYEHDGVYVSKKLEN